MPDAPKNLSIRNLRAPTADAIAKIKADEAMPAEDKAWLVAKIQKSGFAGVIVDAHEAFHDGATHLHASITKLFLALLLPLLMMASSGLAAITSSNMVTYATTSGASTNNGVPVLIGTAYVPTSPNFVISYGNTTTNALTVYVQYGLDTNYYATVATFTNATSTNASEAVITPGSIKINIYAQTKVITTNAMPVGTKLILTQ